MQVGVMHPTTILDAPTRSLQNIEDEQADEPAKGCDTVRHLRVVSIAPPWLETSYFQKKNMYMQGVLWQVMELARN
jgi:hypothetical protein